MTDYSEIIDRLEKADGSNREVDALIYHDILGMCRHKNTTYSAYQDDTGFDCDDCGADSWGNKGKFGQELYDKPPAYTASLDAAIALVEKMLPNHGRMHSNGRLSVDEPLFGVKLYEHELCVGEDPHETAEAEHDHEAIALLIAMFRALQAQETASDD